MRLSTSCLARRTHRRLPSLDMRGAKWTLLAACLTSFNCFAAATTTAAPSLVTVTTPAGAYTGERAPDLHIFRGIRYAEPPVGPLRWKPPVALTNRTEPVDATRFGADCAQQSPYPESRGNGNSEDCLFLNVWAPADSTKPLPVIVYIHGGGFEYGSGAIPMYDGGSLARHGAVVVTFNYRLGIFGFMAHAGLDAESAQHTSGNYGLLDQMLALDWVQKNIASLGGDPHRVTLMGQSAGSRSISMLMTSPAAAPLFQQVILQSGPGLRHITTLPEAEQLSAKLGTIDNLRRMSTAELLKISGEMKQSQAGLLEPSWAKPVVDNWIVPGQQFGKSGTGAFRAVPMLLGTNADEGGAFVSNLKDKNAEDFDRHLVKNFGNLAPRLAAIYDTKNGEKITQAYARLWTDMEFDVPASWLSTLAAKQQPATYRYSFARHRDNGAALPVHGGELQYVFGTLDTPHKGKVRPAAAQDWALSENIQKRWVAFAANGAPSPETGLRWPSYAQAQQCLILDTPVRVQSCPDTHTVERILAHENSPALQQGFSGMRR
jgi:para-nitrobenzyl esterase